MIYLSLFARFALVGLFAVGGGLATLPFLSQMADATGWFTQMDLANMLAISESTPGPIGINMATYTGFITGGPLGGLVATLGLITPSIVVILLIAGLLEHFSENPLVKGAFYGLRPASAALIAAAGLQACRIAFWDADAASWLAAVHWKGLILAAALYFLIRKTKKHPVVYLGIAAAAGVAFRFAA